jgi:3-isopropylmalate dehydratase small subunit
MAPRRIHGRVFVIDGDVDTDIILAARHLSDTDPAAIARNCFADLGATPSFTAGQYPIVIVSGLFGIGLVRPPVPMAMRAAGIEAVVAGELSPLFFEHSLNGGAVLPLQAKLPRRPSTGEVAQLLLDGERAQLIWDAGNVDFPCRLPPWSLAGESWVETVQKRVEEAGGLSALQASLRRG